MKIYAVVCKKTGEVIAEHLHFRGNLKINDIRVGIADFYKYSVGMEDGVIGITEVFLSSSAEHISRLKTLPTGCFLSIGIPEENIDFLYLSQTPEKTLTQCGLPIKS